MSRELQEFIDLYFKEDAYYTAETFDLCKSWWVKLKCIQPQWIHAAPEKYVFICKSNGQGGMTKPMPWLYPDFANVKYCVQAVHPQLISWQRTLTYEECCEFGFNVVKPKASRQPFVVAGNSDDYRQLKIAHNHTLSEFSQQCHEFVKNVFPGYPYNLNSYIIRKSWKQPGWDFSTNEWIPRDQFMIKLAAYYESPKWFAKRDQVFQRDDWQCVRCGSPEDIQCHHVSRKNQFNELLTDLVTMCKRCHHSRHESDLRRKGRI